ncbi:glycerophosphodiester phosphodiesterase family protein [Shimia marina]|uniref:Glycerophosphoryl diester phosphodiesterase n=1 Tax=Shimia marina TaxID=321267 RepID=A0A0P1FCY5_9RHOB|nr:glycerophosphodiester phosphodiesterase family protein [Shimia marina]CUH53735.1 Glycerophosphoryl diester phosphodiesterase [Shimia marina]SFD69736.1 glycerophosphoryl diester phosphodiesterase [Shimia marina]
MAHTVSDVLQHYKLAWRLRLPFVKTHVIFNILMASIFAPLMALTVFVALKLSGKPALADFDIAVFLLSPVGLLAGVTMAGLFIVLLVLDVSLMMAVALRDHQAKSHDLWDGVSLVLPRLPAVFGVGVQLALRVLVMAVPFLAIAGAAFVYWLTEHDINYYLSQHPPEFRQAVMVIGGALAALIVLLIWRSLGWVLSVPLVVFDGLSPRAAIRESQQRMQGRRVQFLGKLVIWAAMGGVISLLLLAAVGMLLQLGLEFMPFGLRGVAVFLLLSTGVWALLNLFLTAFTTGALAVSFMEEADWPRSGVQKAARMPRVLLIMCVMLALGVSVLGGLGVAGVMAVDSTRPVAVIAHRGAAGARPENTMASVLKAIEDQTDWVEIDVQETRDGAVVVIHDSDFMKVAGNPLKIWDATLTDLEKIDIGSWYDPAYAAERTPLLKDILLAAKDKAGVVIELKYYGHDEMLEQRVVDIVEETGMQDQVKIMSLKYDAVQKMRTLRPDWTIGLLASASLGNMWKLDADFLAVNSATISTRLVRSSQEVGKKVYVWTVNDALSMSGMLSFGVDGLITDEPALARQVLADRRTLSGVERLVLGLAGRIGLDLPERDDSES